MQEPDARAVAPRREGDPCEAVDRRQIRRQVPGVASHDSLRRMHAGLFGQGNSFLLRLRRPTRRKFIGAGQNVGMHTPRTAVLAVLCSSLALGACGSSGSGDSGGGGTLSRQDLVSKANEICRTAQAKASSIQAPANIQDAKAAAAYFDKVAPITAKETSDLKALKAPDAVKKDWDAFVTAQVAANDLLEQIKQKADKADSSGLQDLKKIPAVSQKVVTTAQKIGATDCTA